MKYQLFIISLVVAIALKAQSVNQPSQFYRNMIYINPSYVGVKGTAVASLMHRTNWVGFNGAVSYQNFEVHSPLKKKSVAIGVQARHEKVGATNSTELFFNYGHRIRMGDANMALGVKGGMQSKSVEEISLRADADPAFEENKSELRPNFGFGASYYSRNYFVGVAIPELLSYLSGSDGNSDMEFDMQEFSYILSAGGKVALNEGFVFEPAGMLVYSPLLKPSYTFVLNSTYKNMFTGGVGYRANEAILFNAGYQLNSQMSIMYSYDYNIGLIGAYSKGSHEVGLLLYLGYEVKAGNPRDF